MRVKVPKTNTTVMKTRLIGIVLLLSASLVAQAQQKGNANRPQRTPEEKAEMLTRKLSKELSLSEDQIQKVEVLNKEHVERLSEIRNNNQAAKQGNRQSMAEARQQYDATLQGLLTEAQYKQFQEMKQKQQAAAMERRARK